MRWRALNTPARVWARLARALWWRFSSWRKRRAHLRQLQRRRRRRRRYNGWDWNIRESDSGSSSAEVLALLKQRGVGAIAAAATPKPPNYQRKSSLLTDVELSFMNTVEQAFENDYRLFAKVRVADVLEVDAAPHSHERRLGFKLVARKHFSFVLCELSSSDICCAIELESIEPKNERRLRQDEFLDGICASAQLPLIRFQYASGHDPSDVRERLIRALDKVAQEQCVEPPLKEDS